MWCRLRLANAAEACHAQVRAEDVRDPFDTFTSGGSGIARQAVRPAVLKQSYRRRSVSDLRRAGEFAVGGVIMANRPLDGRKCRRSRSLVFVRLHARIRHS